MKLRAQTPEARGVGNHWALGVGCWMFCLRFFLAPRCRRLNCCFPRYGSTARLRTALHGTLVGGAPPGNLSGEASAAQRARRGIVGTRRPRGGTERGPRRAVPGLDAARIMD